MNLLSYFDLNRRTRRASKAKLLETEALITFGDVDSDGNYSQITLDKKREGNIANRDIPTPPPLSSPPPVSPPVSPPIPPTNLGRQRMSVMIWQTLTRSKEGQMSPAEQFLMYFGVVLGVYFSGLIRGQESKTTLLLSALIGLVIIPIAFEKLSVNPKAPLLVRFGLFVQNGVFWDVLFGAIGKVTK